jgi:hypothetical protein
VDLLIRPWWLVAGGCKAASLTVLYYTVVLGLVSAGGIFNSYILSVQIAAEATASLKATFLLEKSNLK